LGLNFFGILEKIANSKAQIKLEIVNEEILKKT